MIPLVLFVTALLVRAAVAAVFPGPAYPDSYYYAHVAEHVAAGRGFVTDYVWNLDDVGAAIPTVGELPIAANAYWMPLAEVVQVPGIWLFGAGPLATGLPFWLIGALAAPIAYWIGHSAGMPNNVSATAGMLVAVPAGMTPFIAQPDNFALFMVLGSLSLWLGARALRGQRRAFLLGGLLVGLATLARFDGVLLGIPFVAAAILDLRRRQRMIGLAAATAFVLIFAIVLSPWLFRQLEVFGSLVPAASDGRTLWLISYEQLFSFSEPPTSEDWLAQGPVTILASRLGALVAAIGLFAFLPLAVVLVPFLIIGAFVNRASGTFGSFFVYAGALFAVMSLLFAVLVTHGTFIHAAAALVPHSFLLVAAGIAVTVDWVARRRATWDAPAATRVFLVGAVLIAAIAASLQTVSTTRSWSEVRAVQAALVEPLRHVPATDRFMAADPGAINHLTGRQGIVTPHDPLPIIESAMRAYDVRWLALESRSIVPALVPVLEGSLRPDWLSTPIASVRGATTAGVEGAETATVATLYAVCFAPTDTRCLP